MKCHHTSIHSIISSSPAAHVVGLQRASRSYADGTGVTSRSEHLTAGVSCSSVCPAITTGDVPDSGASISQEDDMEQSPLKTYKGNLV